MPQGCAMPQGKRILAADDRARHPKRLVVERRWLGHGLAWRSAVSCEGCPYPTG